MGDGRVQVLARDAFAPQRRAHRFHRALAGTLGAADAVDLRRRLGAPALVEARAVGVHR